MNENKEKREAKISLPLLIAIMLLIIIGAIFGLNIFFNSNEHQIVENPSGEITGSENNESGNNGVEEIVDSNENNETAKNGLSEFDLSFLKLENQKENKIYSPLSIKYALKMLEEGASGESKEQITDAVGNSDLTKYNSNSNMSLANALFIRDSYKEGIKESYSNTLKEKYNAEVIFDSFETAENINSWISEKTLNLINNLLEDVSNNIFILVNALGIDMEWEDNFLSTWEEGLGYKHEAFGLNYPELVVSHDFHSGEQVVSGMEIVAAINNYDIVNELGEENIRQTFANEYREWLKKGYEGQKTEEEIESEIQKYFEEGIYDENASYFDELNSNYKTVGYSTEFMMHVDESVKVFAKDLKEYNGTTLQYIGIMPTTEELDNYVENIEIEDINYIINNLKELKPENFKEGVVTKIIGFIPKFKFDYELKLKEDLKNLGIKSVFEQEKAELTQISETEGVFITDAKHKANIEFTQDGIKAAAATIIGGGGGGGPFEYNFEVPVEEIDLTFDKPYMFLIRDKETGEIWFTGTVYEPLAWEDEPEKELEII